MQVFLWIINLIFSHSGLANLNMLPLPKPPGGRDNKMKSLSERHYAFAGFFMVINLSFTFLCR